MSARFNFKTLPNGNSKLSSFFVGHNRQLTHPIANPLISNWTRPSDWLVMPSITSAEQKIACLVYISNDDSNFLAFTVQGNYTVDWGDGVVENFSSGVSSYHTYDYSTYDVANSSVTSDGFKQVIVLITPQSGSNLTLLNFQTKHTSAASANSYSQPIWEIYLSAPNLSSITISASSYIVSLRSVRYIKFINTGSITSFSGLCQNCFSLVSVSFDVIGAITTTDNMFNGCSSLRRIYLFNTSACTDMSSMFQNCFSLTSIPLFNTSACTNMSYMFQYCVSLTSIPLFNTSACTNMSSMFHNCSSLINIPLFNTSACTNMSAMFYNCVSLTSIPLFNTSACTNMSYMFQNCVSLTSIPLFNTSACTNMSYMFYNCPSLVSVTSLAMNSVTNAANMFDFDTSLSSLGINQCKSTLSISNCKLSKSSLESIFSNLGLGTSQTITVTNNFGAPTPISLSGTTTSGSTVITMDSTTGLSSGMQITGTGTPLTTAIAVTFTDIGDTVNLTSHGLSDNDPVSFSSITTTTGIVVNTIYYVINSLANSFQVSDTIGGSAKSLTTDGSGALKYGSAIASIIPNTSVTMTRPMTSSATNTLAFRSLQISSAVLKGWTVTN